MNVIVFSKRIGRARQIELTRPLALTVTIALVAIVLGGAFITDHKVGTRGLLHEPTAQVMEWAQTLELQRRQVLEAKRQLQEKLDSLASRIGMMNAHVIRLDALGKRLTDMANLNRGEFNFDRAPAQGGPVLAGTDGIFDSVAARAPDLAKMLDDLTKQIQDRERQLSVLENLISSRDLNRDIRPDGRPVLQGWISSYFGSR